MKDNQNASIKDAKFELSHDNPEEQDHLRSGLTRVRWLEGDDSFLFAHGMCGEHRGRLKISAEGFEPIERPIDLAFGFQTFVVKLKRTEKNEAASFVVLASLSGKIKRTGNVAMSGIKVILTDQEGKRFETETDADGYYRLKDLPAGKYKIELVGAGKFSALRYEDLRLVEGQNQLDAVLSIDSKTSVTELVCTPNKYRSDKFDCLLTTKNPTKQNQK